MTVFNICILFLVQANVYVDSTGACAAFLANIDDKNDTVVVFRNKSYHLPAWSVSILPDCKNVAFNTAKVCQFSLALSCLQIDQPQHRNSKINPIQYHINTNGNTTN